MYTSGVTLPGLGSLKDKLLRRFMDHETKRRLKSEQMTWTIAYLAAGESNKDTLLKIWKDLVALEFGGEDGVGVNNSSTDSDTEERWLKEYEAMKSRDVKLVRKNNQLKVTGLD